MGTNNDPMEPEPWCKAAMDGLLRAMEEERQEKAHVAAALDTKPTRPPKTIMLTTPRGTCHLKEIYLDGGDRSWTGVDKPIRPGVSDFDNRRPPDQST